MKAVTMFETFDGKIFETEQQAREHEEALKPVTLSFVNGAVEMPREEGASFLVKLINEKGETYFRVLIYSQGYFWTKRDQEKIVTWARLYDI